MNRKVFAIILAAVMVLTMAACGSQEAEETTLTGMVVSLDGTTLSLVEMDSMGSIDIPQGERPEGMENFQGFGGFNPGDFDGTMPESMEGFNPEDFDGTMPEGMEGFGGFGGFVPGDFDGTMPEGMEDFNPEDLAGMMPQRGERPEGFGGMGGFAGAFSAAETKTVDIASAHISLEIEGGKASGSLEDLKPGSFVTITINGKGQATYVLISAQSGIGGRNNRN